jgi:hypothetical protein
MKRLLFLLFPAIGLSLLLATSPARAYDEGQLGVGVILGEPTGFTGKYFTNPSNAFDLGVAYSFGNFFEVYGDYLWHYPLNIERAGRSPKIRLRTGGTESNLHYYFGVGGVLIVSSESHRSDGRYFTSGGNSTGVGLRIPVGLEFEPAATPIGLFIEIVPAMGVVPDIFLFLQGGLGVRIYFN